MMYRKVSVWVCSKNFDIHKSSKDIHPLHKDSYRRITFVFCFTLQEKKRKKKLHQNEKARVRHTEEKKQIFFQSLHVKKELIFSRDLILSQPENKSQCFLSK